MQLENYCGRDLKTSLDGSLNIKQRLTIVDTASSSTTIPAKVLFIFMAKYTKGVHYSPTKKKWYTDQISYDKLPSVLPFCRRGTFLGFHLHATGNQKIRHRVNGRQCIGNGRESLETGRRIVPSDLLIEDILKWKIKIGFRSSCLFTFPCFCLFACNFQNKLA